MNVGQLKELLEDFSDSLEVVWGDPNFGGELGEEYPAPTLRAFGHEPGKLVINIPAVPPMGE